MVGRRHLQRPVYASVVVNVFYHRRECHFNIVAGGTRRRHRYKADRGRQLIVDAMGQFPEQKRIARRRLITWRHVHRIVGVGYSGGVADSW